MVTCDVYFSFRENETSWASIKLVPVTSEWRDRGRSRCALSHIVGGRIKGAISKLTFGLKRTLAADTEGQLEADESIEADVIVLRGDAEIIIGGIDIVEGTEVHSGCKGVDFPTNCIQVFDVADVHFYIEMHEASFGVLKGYILQNAFCNPAGIACQCHIKVFVERRKT